MQSSNKTYAQHVRDLRYMLYTFLLMEKLFICIFDPVAESSNPLKECL